MSAIGQARSLLREYRRPFVILNALYFGLVLLGVLLGALNPGTQRALGEQAQTGAGEMLPRLADAYRNGEVPLAIALTLLVNLIGGSLLCITLPSLLVPFSGLLLGCVRAVMWGLIFAPTLLSFSGPGCARGLLTILLILLEGEGYVLAMLTAYLQGVSFVRPVANGAANHKSGYRLGLQRTGQLYPLVALQLLVAAIYEVLLVVYVLPLLK